jgi:hypothetical protein
MKKANDLVALDRILLSIYFAGKLFYFVNYLDAQELCKFSIEITNIALNLKRTKSLKLEISQKNLISLCLNNLNLIDQKLNESKLNNNENDNNNFKYLLKQIFKNILDE